MIIKMRTFLTATAALLVPAALMLPACSDDANPNSSSSSSTSTSSTSSTGTGGSGSGICLLNNCTEDAHCDGCADGRNTCLVAENRCVACDPNTGEGCPDGEECSAFGICVPAGLTCPTDGDGNPTVTCTANSDCKACSPMHQVCDTTTGKCQACTETNTQHCLSSDMCLDGKCSPKCPASCTVDNDCSQCGGPGNEAHACFAHKCAECSDTWPCAASTGMECVNGVCTPPCGLPGPEAGTCVGDEDCTFCGDPNEVWTCKVPVNGGNHGNCMPPANGCSDLGTNVAVLPPPYDQYTQLCSNDGDCTQSQAGIQYNVGALIRDLTGKSEIMGVTIHDANIHYAMPICAEVSITENIDCGVCVPCETDADCAPIDIDPLIVDIFASDPLAMIAGALLIDLLWGQNEDHHLNFFCQPVAFGYGACIPCGNPLQPCGTGGGGGGTGTCDHDVCTTGAALNSSCGPCAQTVCNADAFCCDAQNGSWDQLCVDQADSLCGNICTGGGGCSHGPCAIGDALVATCSPCVAAICGADPFCCNTNGGSWDQYCVDAVATTTECSSENCGGGSTCNHSPCVAGGKLTSGCDGGTCVSTICGNDSFCCNTEWDSVCVSAAQSESACNCN